MENKNSNYVLYKKLLVIADNISAEARWLYVNYEILIAADKKEVSDKFINTYAGNIWFALRRSLLNETLIGISKLIIDKKDNPSSFHSLHELLKEREIIKIIKLNYTQADSEFQNRYKALLDGLLRLEGYLKTHDVVKSLVRHRNNYLVHRSQKVSSKTEKLK